MKATGRAHAVAYEIQCILLRGAQMLGHFYTSVSAYTVLQGMISPDRSQKWHGDGRVSAKPERPWEVASSPSRDNVFLLSRLTIAVERELSSS